jgi:anti-sigma factor ChrR (cupin superfamily)
VKGSQYYSCSPAQWQAAGTEGFWIKPLYEDLERGEKTMLMKVDPGAFAPSHTHEGYPFTSPRTHTTALKLRAFLVSNHMLSKSRV